MDEQMDEQTERRIRARAHAIWEAEGRPEQRDVDHWMQAVREVTGDGSVDAAGTPAGKKDGAQKDMLQKDEPQDDHAQVVAPTPPQGR